MPWASPAEIHAAGFAMIMYPTTLLFQITRTVERALATLKAGKPMPHNYMGSHKDGAVKLSAYGPAVPSEAQAKIEAIKAEMTAGKFQMFKGPLKDNKGAEVIPAGKAFDDQDPALWGMNSTVRTSKLAVETEPSAKGRPAVP